MSSVTQDRNIDGFQFQVTQLPGMRSLRMFARLGRLFGPVITKALTGLNMVDLAKLDVAVLGAAVSELFMNLTEDELEKLTRDLLASATIDGLLLLPVIDIKLQGHTLTILKLLVFALEVNYQSFFDALTAVGVNSAALAKASASPSPST